MWTQLPPQKYQHKEFHDKHGNRLEATFDSTAGRMLSLSGLKANIKDYGLSQADLNESSVLDAGKKFLHDYGFVAGIDSDQAVKKDIRNNKGMGWFVQCRQAYHKVPIDGSDIRFLIHRSGEFRLFEATTFSNINIPTNPPVSGSDALTIVKNENKDAELKFGNGPELVIYPKKNAKAYQYYLAWVIYVLRTTPHTIDGFKYVIDAQNGDIIENIKQGES